MTHFPEKVLEEDLPTYLKALMSAYEDHIRTLKERIKELEGLRVPIGPMIHEVKDLTPPKPVIRTTSQLVKALEARSVLDMEKGVKEEDVR